MAGTGSTNKTNEEKERARLLLILKGLPFALVIGLTLRQIKQVFLLGLSIETIRKVKGEFEREGKMSRKEINAEDVGARVVLERIARIASKTHPVVGDNETVSECDGLSMIVRELRAYDASILTRNQKRTLPKQRPQQQSVNASTRS